MTGYKLIEVECTPICDYTQSKRLRYRFLPGVIYRNDSLVDVSGSKAIYNEIPPFEMDGIIYNMVFDYRLFKSLNISDGPVFSDNQFLFRLKGELLVDIQSRISSHVNRPGIVTVV